MRAPCVVFSHVFTPTTKPAPRTPTLTTNIHIHIHIHIQTYLIEVMAINSISPFILNARLKPLLAQTAALGAASTTSLREKSAGVGTSGKTSGSGIGSGSGGGAVSLCESLLSRSQNEGDSSGSQLVVVNGNNRSNGNNGEEEEGEFKKSANFYNGDKKEGLAYEGFSGGADGGSGGSGKNNSEDQDKHSDSKGIPKEKDTRVHHTNCTFVVNVSSMEGKFYRRKLATHTHTNMAKSALNMMTRTSAQDYSVDNIFMTAVDTGWINDENPRDKAVRIAQTHNFATPLDEVDAAARILDPIFAPLKVGQDSERDGEGGGEREVYGDGGKKGGGGCQPAYGCFLKDYFLTEW